MSHAHARVDDDESDDEEEDKGRRTVDLHIHPSCGVVLSTPWQLSPSPATKAAASVTPFTLSSPPAAVALIERNAPPDTPLGGFLSPPVAVTITDRRARTAVGIPLRAAWYAFAYPLECLSGQYEQLVALEGRCDPWLFFLLLGGFAYFDGDRKLISTNAFVLTPSLARISLEGPFVASSAALEQLHEGRRLRSVTLAPLLAGGFTQFAWVNPHEDFGGQGLLQEGGATGSGCFVYQGLGGGTVVYSLVTLPPWSLVGEAQRVVADVWAYGRRFLFMGSEGASGAVRTSAADGVPAPGARRASLAESLAETHARLLSSMGAIADAAELTATAAQQLKTDLVVWRRTAVEKWLRSHGLLIFSYYLLGVASYGFFEGWHPLDSVYYLTATATTNGDEIVPTTAPGKLFSCVYILLGISVVFGGISPVCRALRVGMPPPTATVAVLARCHAPRPRCCHPRIGEACCITLVNALPAVQAAALMGTHAIRTCVCVCVCVDCVDCGRRARANACAAHARANA